MVGLISLLQEGVQWLAQGINNIANLTKGIMVEDVASIKDEGWLLHLLIHSLVVVCLEAVPLCEDANCMGSVYCLIWISDSLQEDKAVAIRGGIRNMFRETVSQCQARGVLFKRIQMWRQVIMNSYRSCQEDRRVQKKSEIQNSKEESFV